MTSEQIETRLDKVETQIVYIMEMLEKNAEILKNLVDQMHVFDNRVYDDEAILKIHNSSTENSKAINENLKTIAEIYSIANDNSESVTDIYNHMSEIYSKI